MMDFFATCAKNIEGLLRDELEALGVAKLKETVSGVYFSGELADAYRVCLWSRLANSIYLPLLTFKARDKTALYREASQCEWLYHIASNGNFRIDVTGQHASISHPHFIAHVIKDAIVDQIRNKTGQRPNIQAEAPDVVLNAHVKGEHFTISLDLSGDSLHRRGYRLEAGKAPLKETLAAAILIRAGWVQKLAHATDSKAVLIDPMCGTGTLLIEAALMAYDIAPGLMRNYFGFLKWRGHDKKNWAKLLDEANARREQGLQKAKAVIFGSDHHPAAIRKAEDNIVRAGLADFIRLEKAAVEDFHLPSDYHKRAGLIVCNPPYGERMAQDDTLALMKMWQAFGRNLKAECSGFDLAVITADLITIKSLGMAPDKSYAFFNGTIPCKLLCFHIH